MKRLTNFLAIFLAQPWAGLVIAISIGFLGFAVTFWSHGLGLFLEILAAILLIGVGVSVGRRLLLATKPPGQLFTVKGRKMHLLAEGKAGDKHPVIWVPGGHGSGISLHHLHKALKEETRSILFDRTGSGWSAAMTKPVTFSSETEKLKLLLEAADEKGPWVVAGHSFGGMFCANFAHHYPDLVAGVVLLDSTPPWNVAYAGHVSFPPAIRKSWWGSIASHFGLQQLVKPEISGHEGMYGDYLADVAKAINHNAIQPKAMLAEASAFRSCMENPFELVIGKGALGDIPLLMFSQNPTEQELKELRLEIKEMIGLTEKQADNLMDGLRDSTDQQVALSSNGRLLKGPLGCTHMFPYEVPEQILEEVRTMINRKSL